jgi:hypothetical protein
MRAIATVFMAAVAFSAASPALQAQSSDLPQGWYRAGNHPGDYEMATDPKGGREGKACAFIRGRSAQPQGFGTLMQNIEAEEYRGKRLRFSAQVKAAGIVNWAGLWMRIDGPPQAGSNTPMMLGFDNMQSRSIKGTADWKRYDVVLDVPNEARVIAFGILLAGAGQAWMDDLQFETVGTDVPVTGTGALAKKPNLSFQR